MTSALRDPRNEDVNAIADTARLTTTTTTTTTTIRANIPNEPMQEADAKKEQSLADMAHAELAGMLERCASQATETNSPVYREAFPASCKSLLHSLPGNRNCIDCNARDPEWAAISYGALVCIKCSGKHRSMGVAVSQVRSVAMDHWTYMEVVMMLEGGNAQIGGFFARHALTKKEFEKQEEINKRKVEQPCSKPRLLTAENVTSVRYKTKAALFYKNQLEAHVGRLLGDPARKPYEGRRRSQLQEDSERIDHQQ